MLIRDSVKFTSVCR